MTSVNDTIARVDASWPQGMDHLSGLKEKRRQVVQAWDALIDGAKRAGRPTLQASEQRDYDRAKQWVETIDREIDEVSETERRAAAAAGAVAQHGDTASRGGYGLQGYHVGGGETYHRGNTSPSFFRDLIHAQRGDLGAAERLQRNNTEVGLESRALGNTGGVGGSGGEFAPPGYLVEDYVKLARPGRVTADTFHKEPLPSGVSSVNLPKVTGGTSTAVQTTQNTTLSQTDLTSAQLTSAIVTIGGKEIVSQQLLDQSAVPFDRIILEDLAADYARQLGTQALTGSGTSGQLKGYLTATSSNVVTWTQASPTAAGFYSQLAKLQGQINATRYQAPDAVVMHPRRWAWFASFTDSTGRPLVVPTSGGFNSMANPGPGGAAGLVGSVLGMDVFTDPNIPTNLGAGTNQDVVLMYPREDIWLWESDYRAEAFTAPYADSIGVLFRVFNYSAQIPDRYSASLGQISGTGLTPPVFAS